MNLTDKVTVTKKIKSIKLTGSDWQLFTASMDCTKAAQTLNTAFKKLVNDGMTRQEVQEGMQPIMSRLSDYGAADSEPTHTLLDLLDMVFGEIEY